jgi:hypothetical protein
MNHPLGLVKQCKWSAMRYKLARALGAIDPLPSGPNVINSSMIGSVVGTVPIDRL